MASSSSKDGSPHNSLTIMFVIGPPGVGKGTQCEMLTQADGDAKYLHISVGDYLRKLCKDGVLPEGFQTKGDFTHKDLVRHLEQQSNLPAEQIVALLMHKLETDGFFHGKRIVLIDGFPRSSESAEKLRVELNMKGSSQESVLFFSCPREVAEDRFIARRRGSKDDKEMFNKRYEQFKEDEGAIRAFFGPNVHEVDTSICKEDTFKQLKEVLCAMK